MSNFTVPMVAAKMQVCSPARVNKLAHLLGQFTI